MYWSTNRKLRLPEGKIAHVVLVHEEDVEEDAEEDEEPLEEGDD